MHIKSSKDNERNISKKVISKPFVANFNTKNMYKHMLNVVQRLNVYILTDNRNESDHLISKENFTPSAVIRNQWQNIHYSMYSN